MVYSIVYSILIFSIPNFQRIKVVKKSLENFPIGVVATKVITSVLSLTLTLTNFVLNYKDYLQINVCTIGTISLHHMITSSWAILKENVFTHF